MTDIGAFWHRNKNSVLISGAAIIAALVATLVAIFTLTSSFSDSIGASKNTTTANPTANGCPAGYQEAVGTYYNSWPKPGSVECVQNSGCKWAGLFSSPQLTAGPPQGPCQPGAKLLDGGDGSMRCRWPESTTQQWQLAATWEKDASLVDKSVELFIQTQPQRKVQVNVVDTCSDSDCDGCCSRNSGNGAYKLIDIEKHPVAKLLNLDPAGSQFDGGSINYPTAKGLRPGAPESDVMPLCYRIIGQANLTNK